MEYITKLLRDKGFKATPQRIAIYNALANTKEHPNAESLFATLHALYPTMSLATVYKTLDIFAKLNIVKVLNTNEDFFRYDADITDHAHIRCTNCNKVDDVFDLNVTSILMSAEEKSGYKIQTQELYLFGLCNECKKQIEN